MKRTIRLLVAAVLFAQGMGVALADCPYNGKWYKTGTVLGDRVCAADGTWQRR